MIKYFFKKNKFKILIVLSIIMMLAAYFLAQIDFLGDYVLSELNKAVTEELASELTLDSISGNPITGFKTRKIVLFRSNEELLSIEKADFNLSFLSLLKASPKLSILKLDGIKSDYDSLIKLIPEQRTSIKDLDIPIDKIKLGSAEIQTPLGLLKSVRGNLRLIDSFHFSFNFKGTFAEKSLYTAGTVKKEDEIWQAKDGKIVYDEGRISVDGAFFPTNDLKVTTNNFDLESLFSLFPDLKSHGVKGILTSTSLVKTVDSNVEISSEGELKDTVYKNVPLPKLKFEGFYSKELLKIELLECQVYDSSLCGKLIIDKTQELDFLDLDLQAENLKFVEWTDKIVRGSNLKPHHLPKGNISHLDVSVKGPINALTGEVKVAPSNIEYGKLEFKDVGGSVSFDGSSYGTVDFSATHLKEKISLNGKYSLSNNIDTDLKLSIPSVHLENLTPLTDSLSDSDLKGIIKADITVRGITNNLSQKRDVNKNWIAKAEISTPALYIKEDTTLENLKLVIDYEPEDKLLKLKNASANFKDAVIDTSGTITKLSDGGELSFSGTAKNINTVNFYDIVPFFKNMTIKTLASGKWKLSGSLKKPILEAEVYSDGGELNNIKVDSFASEVIYSERELKLSSMTLKGYGGTATMDSTIQLPSLKPDAKTTLSWIVDGKLNNVNVDLINDAANLKEDIAGVCSANFNVKGDNGGFSWKAEIKDGDPKWKAFSANSLTGNIYGNKDEITVENLCAKFLHGNATIDGKIILPEKDISPNNVNLDLNILTDELNLYELLRKHLPAVRGVQGLLQSEINVKGTAAEPNFTGVTTLTPLRYRDFLLPKVCFDFDANYNGIDISNARAFLKDGSISGTGGIFKKDDKWETFLDVTGVKVDLKQFAAYLPEKARDRLGGRASFELHGAGELGNFVGKGNVKSDWLRVMGIQFTDLNAPFYISDGYAFMEDVKTDMNGGTLSGGIALDLDKNVWGGMLTALDVDVNSTIKQFIPNISGEVSGKADVKIRGQGEAGRLSTINGSGVILMKDGTISDFEAVEAAKKYTSGKPLRFESIQTTFTFDGGNIAILPGSQALAPEGDPVYRYVMLDGLINKEQEVALFAMGKVNIRALNALLGALQGVISVGTDLTSDNMDRNEMLKNFLGGVLSGYTRNEFSFITMNINGKMGALQYSNVKVDKTTTQQGTSKNIPKSDSDPEEKTVLDGNTKIMIKFEIPVGPGKSKTPDSVKDKVVEQTLENLLNNLNFGL